MPEILAISGITLTKKDKNSISISELLFGKIKIEPA